MDSLEKLIEKLKQDKNLNTDLGVRIDLKDFEILSGMIFLVRDGRILVNEDRIGSELAALVWKFLSEELAIDNYVKVDELGQGNTRGQVFEEGFLVIEDLGIISLRQIDGIGVLPSRFWARKVKNYLNENRE